MHTTSETLDGNRVRLIVDIEESEVSAAVEKVFRNLQWTMRVKGFRPGKLPRAVIEAHIGGSQALRAYAMEDLVLDAYVSAVNETGIEAISDPRIEILSGKEEGPLQVEAVVEVRPSVSVAGYQGMEIILPSSRVTEEEVDSYVDRIRSQWAELRSVDRPILAGDVVTMDLEVRGGPQGEVHLDDYVYEVATVSDVPEMGERLVGASPGEVVEYLASVDAGPSTDTGEPDTGEPDTGEPDAPEPVAESSGSEDASGKDRGGDAGTIESVDAVDVDVAAVGQDPATTGAQTAIHDHGTPDGSGTGGGDAVNQGTVLEVKATVKQVEERVLPELDDKWVRDATDQDSVESLRADVRDRLANIKMSIRPKLFTQKVISALTEYVDDEVPSPLVESAFQREMESLARRLDEMHVSLQEFLASYRGDDAISQISRDAIASVKADLALRALADAEGIEVSDGRIDEELSRVAVQSGISVAEARAQYERDGRLVALRSEIRKSEALDWLMRNVHVVDEDGAEVRNEVLLGNEVSPVGE
ncbi:MAG: trigger factor [Actinobacteria bacterium]|nr:trigger factor [Actinomycetota bacterium]MCL5446834.1 trigger factor [Actinomycetota bacterium]